MVPNDPLFTNQWHLRNTGQTGGTVGADANVTPAWDTVRGTGVVIGIVDDSLEHDPDLIDNRWTNSDEIAGNGIDDDSNGNVDDVHGWDFVNGDSDPSNNSYGYGTAVAGVAAARGNNDIGVSGAAPNASLVGRGPYPESKKTKVAAMLMALASEFEQVGYF